MKKPTSDQWMGVGLGVMAAGILAISVLNKTGGPALLPLGEPVPAIAGVTLSGEEVSYPEGDTGGDVLLLDFWASWCPACVRGMPTLERLESEHSGEGLRLLTVNLDDAGNRERQAELVAGFLAEQEIDVPVLLDDGRLQRIFNAYTLPTVYLVGRDGMIRRTWSGSPSSRSLRREVRAALAEEAKR